MHNLVFMQFNHTECGIENTCAERKTSGSSAKLAKRAMEVGFNHFQLMSDKAKCRNICFSEEKKTVIK